MCTVCLRILFFLGDSILHTLLVFYVHAWICILVYPYASILRTLLHKLVIYGHGLIYGHDLISIWLLSLGLFRFASRARVGVVLTCQRNQLGYRVQRSERRAGGRSLPRTGWSHLHSRRAGACDGVFTFRTLNIKYDSTLTCCHFFCDMTLCAMCTWG